MTDKLPLEQEALDRIWFHVTAPAALRAKGGMTVFEKGEGCYLTGTLRSNDSDRPTRPDQTAHPRWRIAECPLLTA